jgi:hypothetical protein
MKGKGIVFPVIFALVAVFGATGLAKDTVVESQRVAGPIRIDGLDQDWQDAVFLIDPGSKAQYAMRNDGNNLFVLFVFKDVKSWTTLEYTGLKVFFSTEGKKSKDLGILFTKKPMATDAIISEMEKRGQPLTEEQKADLRKQKVHMVFAEEPINEKNLTPPSDPMVTTDPPVYRSAGNKSILVCEFRIPFSRINEVRGIGTEPGKTIKLGFEWGGMTREIMKNVMADRAASGARASQGATAMSVKDSSRDEAGGGGPDFAAYTRDPRYKKHSFWIDLKLAAQ